MQLSNGFAGATFIQLWRMSSTGDQHQWLAAMHDNIHLLQVQPGFLTMTLHAGLDGRNAVVYAQWQSATALQAAVSLSEVAIARNELDSYGEPNGTLYKIDSVFKLNETQESALEIAPTSEQTIFINIWTVPGREQQQRLLSAMKAEAPGTISKPGGRGVVLHASLDGTRVAVYALWQNLEAFDAAIAKNPAAQESRDKLSSLGEANPNVYRFDSVNLPTIPSK